MAEKLKLRPQSTRDYWHIGPVYLYKPLALLLFIALALAVLAVFGLPNGLLSPPASTIPAYRYDDARLASLDGLVQVLDQEGQLRYEGVVAQGAYTGLGKVYGAGGALVYEGPLVEGQYEGENAKVYQDGTLVYAGEMRKNRYEGQGRRTDPETGVVSVGQFARGALNGDAQEYDASGVLLREGRFSGDLLEGEGKEYGPDGVLLREGAFSAGLLEGQGRAYTSGGGLRYEGEFRRGVYQGQGVLYDTMQKARVYEGAFVDGKPMGLGTIYHTSGQWLYHGMVHDGQPRADSFLGLSLTEVESAFSEHWLLYTCDGVTAFVYPTFHLMFLTESPVTLVSPTEEKEQTQQERQDLLDAIKLQPQPEDEADTDLEIQEQSFSAVAGAYAPMEQAADERMDPDTDKSDLIIQKVLSYGDVLAGVPQPALEYASGKQAPGYEMWFSNFALDPWARDVLVQRTGQFIYRFTPLRSQDEEQFDFYLAEGGGIQTATVWKEGKDPTIWYQSAIRKEDT